MMMILLALVVMYF